MITLTPFLHKCVPAVGVYKQLENFMNSCFNWWRAGLSVATARIVKSQKRITVPSLNLCDNLKSRRPMHISRMIGESSLWHSKFFSISIIASSTKDSLDGFAFFSSKRRMFKDLKHSMTS